MTCSTSVFGIYLWVVKESQIVVPVHGQECWIASNCCNDYDSPLLTLKFFHRPHLDAVEAFCSEESLHFFNLHCQIHVDIKRLNVLSVLNELRLEITCFLYGEITPISLALILIPRLLTSLSMY